MGGEGRWGEGMRELMPRRRVPRGDVERLAEGKHLHDDEYVLLQAMKQWCSECLGMSSC